jgi:hypothetical protein
MSTARSLLLFKYVRTSKRVSDALSDRLGSQFECAMPFSPSGAGLRLPEFRQPGDVQPSDNGANVAGGYSFDLHSMDILCTCLLFYSEPECLHVKYFGTRRGKLLLKNGCGRGRFLYYKIFSLPSTKHQVTLYCKWNFFPIKKHIFKCVPFLLKCLASR